MSESFVLDASLAANWCLQEELTPATEVILDGFAEGNTALVPALWVWEINNVLLMAQRAGRLSESKRHQQVSLLKKLPINVDEDAREQTWEATVTLAHAHNLSVYDAAYLELSLRHHVPLGSLDKGLRRAAQAKNIVCLPEES